MILEAPPADFVFMKVGSHAGETFEQILERKNREFQDTGRIFWGYGGTACHPLQQVQPFAKDVASKRGSIYLLMEPIHSTADPDLLPATEYSDDGVNWQPIPKGINVTGSRYALILDEIVPGQLEIATEEFVVGIGPSRGKFGSEYLQGRIDKACLTRSEKRAAEASKGQKKIGYMAKLLDPYAVMLK